MGCQELRKVVAAWAKTISPPAQILTDLAPFDLSRLPPPGWAGHVRLQVQVQGHGVHLRLTGSTYALGGALPGWDRVLGPR